MPARLVRRARSHRSRSTAIALGSLFLTVALAFGASACTPKPTVAGLDHKVFATPLPEFDRWWRGEQAAANHVSRATVDRWWQRDPERLDSAAARRRPYDVSTDFCSFAPESGPGFDFRAPCVRHDFAWRNLKRLQSIIGGHVDTHARRLSATRQFLADMRSTCATRSLPNRAACGAVAAAYYRAVVAVS